MSRGTNIDLHEIMHLRAETINYWLEIVFARCEAYFRGLEIIN